MYRVLLLSFLEDLKVDESQAASLAQLSAILALSDAETNSVYTAAAGPLFRKVAGEQGIDLPDTYAVGMVFTHPDAERARST